MLEKIIVFICFFMCSVPFLIISIYNKDSKITPIAFWSGSEVSLKESITDITAYNREMSLLYRKCSIAFLFAGVCSFIHVIIGIILLALICTIGIYLVYRQYKQILGKYSV